MPIQLCYASQATRDMAREDLLDILKFSRERNTADGLSGLLLFQSGQFLQVLEGQADQVHETFERIKTDPRHRQVTLVFEDLVSQREYPDWSMGFQALDLDDFMEFPDEEGVERDLSRVVDSIGRAKALLLYVRKRGLHPEKDIAT